MQLRIEPHTGNHYPLRAILVRGSSMVQWMDQIQALGLHPADMDVYPVPGNKANSYVACVLLPHAAVQLPLPGKNQYLQQPHAGILIPEHSRLYPLLSEEEAGRLTGPHTWLLHPEWGLVELASPVAWENLLKLPEEQAALLRSPAPAPFVPESLQRIFIREVAPEEALKEMEARHFPESKPLADKPLNLLEKIKLGFLRPFFRSPGAGAAAQDDAAPEKGRFLKKLDALIGRKGQKKSWTDKLQMNYEELERRNKESIERLLEMFRKNPELALQYAVPLGDGLERGGEGGLMGFNRRWSDFSLFGNTNFRSGGRVTHDEHFAKLQQQYLQSAKDMAAKKEYHKAAFIYLKLLKMPNMAASVLEEGGHYADAAAIYLKHMKDKRNAAQCYEKGNMLPQAIELYKELGEHEKAGDLYMLLRQPQEANRCYDKVVSSLAGNHQFLKASLVCRQKMNDAERAQEILLQGWILDKDTFNCLNNYITHIEDDQLTLQTLERIRAEEKSPRKKGVILQVIRYEYTKRTAIAPQLREMAYGLILENMASDPDIISEIKNFNKDNQRLTHDIMRFKQAKRMLPSSGSTPRS